MNNFSAGLAVGTIVGAGLLMAVNPMDAKARRKACRKAGKMMHSINRSMRDWT